MWCSHKKEDYNAGEWGYVCASRVHIQVWFQHRHISIHHNEQCKKRPYSCDYCRDYASTFEDVTENHYPQCGNYPVTCPNGCNVHKMEQQDLGGHLRDKCPLTVVDCPFHYAGCETQLPCKDMPEHMEETTTHLILLATVTQRLLVDNQKLLQENQQLTKWVLEREDKSCKCMSTVQVAIFSETIGRE